MRPVLGLFEIALSKRKKKEKKNKKKKEKREERRSVRPNDPTSVPFPAGPTCSGAGRRGVTNGMGKKKRWRWRPTETCNGDQATNGMARPGHEWIGEKEANLNSATRTATRSRSSWAARSSPRFTHRRQGSVKFYEILLTEMMKYLLYELS